MRRHLFSTILTGMFSAHTAENFDMSYYAQFGSRHFVALLKLAPHRF